MQNEFDYRKYLNLISKSKRLFAITALAIMTAAVVGGYLLPKKYEAKSTVFVEKNVISDLVRGIAVTPSMEDTIRVLNHSITSRTLIQKVVDDLDLNIKHKSESEYEDLIKRLQKNTTVTTRDRNLFIISYKDSDPRIARDYVNTLVRRYIESNITSKREESYGAIKFLSEQIDTFREKLDKADAELNRFKTEKGGVINIDEGRLFQEINAAQQRLYDAQLRRRHLEGLRPVTRRAGDPLQTRLVALQRRLEELRAEYTDNYPEVVKTRTEIDTLKEQMKGRKGGEETIVDPQELERVEAEINALRVSEEGLKRYISSNQALLNSIPSAKAGLEKLELEKNNAKTLYDQLVARHGQSEVSKQMEVQDKTTTFRIVDPAVLPHKPASPDRVKIIMMGILAGLAGGLGLLIGLDFFDHSVRTVDSLKTLGISVLAVVPRIRPQELVEQERRKDMRLYAVAGTYFMMILALLVLEVLGRSPVEKVIGKIQTML